MGGLNTGMPEIKFIKSKLNLQVGLPLGFNFYLKWLVVASPDFVTSQRMSVGARIEILLYKETFQGFECGKLFCFQSRDLNCISASKDFAALYRKCEEFFFQRYLSVLVSLKK